MSRILVTGSKGTLGRRLVAALEAAGHEVWGLDTSHGPDERLIRADVGSYRQLERVFDQDYDMVYHLAAEFGRKNGEEYYETLWHTNVIGTRNILELQLKKGFRLIFTSSSEIYGDVRAEWLDEDLPLRQTIIQHNDYALSKWVSETQIMNFEKRYDIPVMRLRLFNAYGPGEHYHRYRSVVCLFVYCALHGMPYTVYEGYHRVFMYVDDLILTMARAVEKFRPGEVYNIGGREYRSVEELSEVVLGATGASRSLVKYEPLDAHNTVNKRPDISRASRDLEHDPKTCLEEGIPLTVAWMRQVYSK
jgi:dTDP-glucose 4,6-dehydratase